MPLTFLDLHLELIYIILEYVHNSSPHTSKSVARVNKCLHDATQVVCNRRRTLYLENKSGLTYANGPDWVHDKVVLNSLRHLTVNNRPRHAPKLSEDENGYMRLVCDLIERIGNLKSLTWNVGPISKRLIDTLGAKHPKAQLRLFNYWRDSPNVDYLTEDELAVSTFKNLTDFRAVIGHKDEARNLIDWNDAFSIDVYKHMISNSRSLQYAGLIDMGAGRGWRIPTGPESTLQELKHNRCESLRSLTLDTVSLELSKELLEDWNGFVNMAQLETLKFVRGQPMLDYFQSAATMLPNIKHVSLNFANMSSSSSSDDRDILPRAANKYLLTCPPLTSLSIWNASEFVDMEELVVVHHETIEVLQIHHNTLHGSRPELPVKTIALMREKCLKLRDLTLDFNRKDYTITHPPFEKLDLALGENKSALKILDEVAMFGNRLKQVQFYVEHINADLESSLFVSPDDYLRYSDAADDDDDDEDNSNDDNDGNDGDEERGEDKTRDGDDNKKDSADLQENQSDKVRAASPRHVRNQPVPSEDLMQQYAEEVWRRVFGAQKFGERTVDVKFGEWESKFRDHRYNNRRWFEVSPHERDDRPGDCSVKVSRTRSQRWNI